MTLHFASRFRRTSGSDRRGFTLLEMVLVMFIVSMLVAAVFGIVNSVTQLTSDMTVEQQREARIHGFVELCARTFRTLPPAALVRLRNQQTGGRLASQLTLAGATSPLSGDTGGVTVIETEEGPDGYFRVVLRAMNAAQALRWEKGETKEGHQIPLLDNVASLEWSILDPKSGKWTSLWNEKMKIPSSSALNEPTSTPTAPLDEAALRPGIVELRVAFFTGTAQRHIFWVPAAEPVNPSGAR